MTKNLNILLAEDDADDRDFFLIGMRQLNLSHRVHWAKNHGELFHLLDTEHPIDLVFLDINMPGKDGKQCLKEMKAMDKFRHVPAVVLTVSKNVRDIEEVYVHGAHYYVVKPYSLVNYVETLRQILHIDWKAGHAVPPKEEFVINLAFA